MNKYDIKCPICGTINRDLFLDETDGWMECEKCGTTSKSLKDSPRENVRIPIYTEQQRAELCAHAL